MGEPMRKSGQLILISRQLRLDLTDCQALDLELSDVAFRIACVIGTHYGNKSGLAFLSLDYLKAATRKSGTTIQRAISELEDKGYLIIVRRSIGARIWKGKTYPVFGGKGSANEYRPACDSIQVTTLNPPKNLVDRVATAWRERVEKLRAKHSADGVLSKRKHHADGVLSIDQSTPFRSSKHPASVVPTLNLLSEDNSSRARAPNHTNGLGPAGDALKVSLGNDKFDAWFGSVALQSSDSETVTLEVNTKFKRDYIEAQFHADILRAFQGSNPKIKFVRVVVSPSSAGPTQ